MEDTQNRRTERRRRQVVSRAPSDGSGPGTSSLPAVTTSHLSPRPRTAAPAASGSARYRRSCEGRCTRVPLLRGEHWTDIPHLGLVWKRSTVHRDGGGSATGESTDQFVSARWGKHS